MFMNVQLNRENAQDMLPTRYRIKSMENQDIGLERKIWSLIAYQSKGKLKV